MAPTAKTCQLDGSRTDTTHRCSVEHLPSLNLPRAELITTLTTTFVGIVDDRLAGSQCDKCEDAYGFDLPGEGDEVSKWRRPFPSTMTSRALMVTSRSKSEFIIRCAKLYSSSSRVAIRTRRLQLRHIARFQNCRRCKKNTVTVIDAKTLESGELADAWV